MGDVTEISWTDHTFNSWWGCSRVSPGCKFCYAEAWDHRTGGDHWGRGAERRAMSDSYWRKPIKWNKQAKDEGRRHRVFCSSMADVFDEEAPAEQRDRLWAMIKETPGLDWQLLTKRPQNIKKYLPRDWATYYSSGAYYPNVWLGVTAEDQKRTDERGPLLLSVPAAIHFFSCEPLLERVDVSHWTRKRILHTNDGRWLSNGHAEASSTGGTWLPGVDWVIVGGESGPGARIFDMVWARAIVRDCKENGAKVFVKQMGSRPCDGPDRDLTWFSKTAGKFAVDGSPRFADKKGGDPSEWPEELRIREFPR